METRSDQDAAMFLGYFDTPPTNENNYSEQDLGTCKQVDLNCDLQTSVTRKRVDVTDNADIQCVDITIDENDTTGNEFSGKVAVHNEPFRRRRMPSTITSVSKEAHEFVSVDMFSNFMTRYQTQMDSVQNSLKTLNDSLNESFYYEEEYEDVSLDSIQKENEDVNGKRKAKEQVSDFDTSAKKQRRESHAVSEIDSACGEDLGGNDNSAGLISGGSALNVNTPDENVLNVNIDTDSGASCFDASKLLEEKILEFNTEEKTAPNLNDNLAKFINSLLANQMTANKRNELYDKYLRPGNCNLNYPTVNDVIWDNCISSFGRSQDVKLHTIQRCLLKGLTPVVNMVNRLVQNKDFEIEKSVLTQELLDSVALLASTSYSLSQYRRANIRQYLKDEFQSLCMPKTQITDKLFGDDVVDKIKGLSESRKMAALVTNKTVGTDKSNEFSSASGASFRGGSFGFRFPRVRGGVFRGRGGRRRFLGRGQGRGHRPPQKNSSHNSQQK